jgi:hypothetical protein
LSISGTQPLLWRSSDGSGIALEYGDRRNVPFLFG